MLTSMPSALRASWSWGLVEEDEMQLLKNVGVVIVLGAVIAACGGNAATQAPAATQDGGGGGGGGGATEEPMATENGGGGGGGGGGGVNTAYGKVTIEISGPVQKKAEYGFVPAASMFAGDQGSSLNFTNEDSNAVVSILISEDKSVVVSWGTDEFSAPATECTTKNWNVGATSASGEFECTAALVITASGATVTGGTVKGSFTAHI